MFETLVRALQCGRRGCACQRWAGNGNLHCPVKSGHAHGDADPGLTTKVGGTTARGAERIVFHCQKGCSADSVISELRGMNLWPPPNEEPPAATPDRERPRKLVKEWPYRSADGHVIAYKARFEYQDRDNGKTFLWRREGTRQYGGLQGISMEQMPPYNLEGVLGELGEPVYIVEGEKAADACIDHGLVAISFGGGANQQRFGDLDYLHLRDVILWPDNDDVGYALMARLAALRSAAARGSSRATRR